jgi:4-hydroxybutyrate dehydrogenase/sulfolactaldehyde 3-reductase
MGLTGFIGLGHMGEGMARQLQSKGHKLAVYDVRNEPVEGLVSMGAENAGSVAGVAKASDVIVTMLPASADVEQVVLGPDGVLANGREGQLVMDMSTVDPETSDKLARELAKAGIGFVDAPVGRLASHAWAGESLFMVGASDDDFARVKPLLEAMGTTIYHCGGPGTGTRTKLVNNFLTIGLCQMNAEVLTLSQAFGLDLETTFGVLNGTTGTNGQLKVAYANKVLKGDTEPGFRVTLAHKDMSLICNAANAVNAPVPLAASVRESLSLAKAGGYAERDFSSALDHWCERAGVPKARFKDAG